MANSPAPADFRGYAGDPRNELEVVYLFGLAQGHLPFPFVVNVIRPAFPDCEGVDPTTGRPITIEFERRSRHFGAHRHPESGCDYIVCWEDDWKDAPAAVRNKIVSLKDIYLKQPELRDRFRHVPLPNLLRDQLERLRTANPQQHEAVARLLDGLSEMQDRIPALTVGDAGRRHFSISYGSGKNIFGVRPDGTLVVGTEDDMVARYGESVRAPTVALRARVKKIGALTTPCCQELLDDVEQVMLAIAASRRSS